MAPDYPNCYDSPYQREEARAPREAIGNTQAYPARKPGFLRGLFEDLSFAQVVAGAAAAATSVVLASKIGIAGSVIGAAVSSVVTVVSSQIYRHFITTGAEKLKGAYTGGDVRESAYGAYAAGGARVPGDKPLGTGVIGWSANADAAHEGGWESSACFKRSANCQPCAGTGAQMGARIAPERLRARAKAERASTQRKVIGFSAIAAILAVAACVAIILLSTAGEGIGTKPEAIFTAPAATQDAPEDAEGSATDSQTAEEPAQADDSSEQEGSGQSPANDPSASDDQNVGGATSSPDATTGTEPDSSSGTGGANSDDAAGNTNSGDAPTGGSGTATGGAAQQAARR